MKRKKTEVSRFRHESRALKSEGVNHQDRLSLLPDSLLVSILSLLPIEDAASTSVLSHRWTHLWTQISHLHFRFESLPRRGDGRYVKNEVLSFISTVDHIFEKLTSNKIHTLHLEFPFFDSRIHRCASAVERWLGYVYAHNVEVIKVSNGFCLFIHNNKLATCFLISPSLVVLEILDGFCLKLPDDGIINLPNLNKLLLRRLDEWDCQTMSRLFKSCPLLEVLDLSINWRKDEQSSIDVSCQNLRSLTIKVYSIRGWDYIINAPKLEYFEMLGSFSSFRFVENPCLLTKAKIMWQEFRDAGVDYLEGIRMSALVQGICSVQILELTSVPLCSLVHLDGHTVPTFHNLSELKIRLDKATAGKNLVCALHCAPNLEVLYIDKTLPEKGVKWDVPNSVPLCVSRKIKKIKAMQLEGSREDLKFLKYILANANVLDSVFVGVASQSQLGTQLAKEARFCKDLFTCPRSSKACVIAFQGGYLHASSTDNHSCARLKCEIEL